jgi:hypothetical protein
MAGPDPLPALPARPMLRPGLRVVRRDDTHLQVGLGPGRRVLPDTPVARALLAGLAAGRTPAPPHGEEHALCVQLHHAGLLVDGDAYWRGSHRPALAAAAYAQDPYGAPEALRRRAETTVALDLPEDWRDRAADLVTDTGLRLARGRGPGAVRLLGRAGEPDRSTVDELVRTGEPHLLLSCVDGVLCLGPFVVPGRTACLRCVDAHLGERDPRRALVVEQYTHPDTVRPTPEPCDEALLMLALAWAARDLATWAEGRAPSLWSTSVWVTPALDLPRRFWARHPHCGCSWGDVLLGC